MPQIVKAEISYAGARECVVPGARADLFDRPAEIGEYKHRMPAGLALEHGEGRVV